MISRQLWNVAVLFLGIAYEAAAELPPLLPPNASYRQVDGELPVPSPETEEHPSEPFNTGSGAENDVAADPIAAEGEVIIAPTETGHWNVQADLIASTFHANNGFFGGFSEDPSFAARLTTGYEDMCGSGLRSQAWFITDRIPAGFTTVDIDAATVYFDAYYEQGLNELEILLGCGAAAAYMDFMGFTYAGAGASIFAEGFYPVHRTHKWDIGLAGRGRLALLASIEDELMEGWGSTIDEFGWGLRLRRRADCDEAYWTIDIMREAQHWSSTSEPFASDQSFFGTAVKVGYVW